MRSLCAAFPLLLACQGNGEPVDPGDDPFVPDVRINEVMASNQAAVADPNGGFPDWIELANFDAEEVDLSGATLTDDPAQTDKWAIPDGTVLAAGDYLVVWADGEGNEPMTATFRLSADGEALGLYGPDGVRWDQIEFGPQETDVAWARTPDGADTWAAAAEPTPGEANP